MKKQAIKTLLLFLLGPLSLIALASYAQADEVLSKRSIDQIGITNHNNIILLTKDGRKFKAETQHCPVITNPSKVYFQSRVIRPETRIVIYNDKPSGCRLNKLVKLTG